MKLSVLKAMVLELKAKSVYPSDEWQIAEACVNLIQLAQTQHEALAVAAKLGIYMPGCGHEWMPGSFAYQMQGTAQEVFQAHSQAYWMAHKLKIEVD